MVTADKAEGPSRGGISAPCSPRASLRAAKARGGLPGLDLTLWAGAVTQLHVISVNTVLCILYSRDYLCRDLTLWAGAVTQLHCHFSEHSALYSVLP